jgi:S-adenosylmethionine hydrolase
LFIFEQMSLITLTTDLGYRDPYLAIVKANLLSKASHVNVIDLSCDVKNSSITDVAYIIRQALKSFQANTIHLVGIKSGPKSQTNKSNEADNTRYLITQINKQYIVSPDNGLFTLIDKQFNEVVYQIYYNDNSKHRFFLNDVFVEVALHLAGNKSINEIANQTTDYYKIYDFEPFLSGTILKGKKIYIDDFGNIITNVTKEIFDQYIGNKPFTIKFPGAKIQQVSTTYDDVDFGKALVLFNSFGYLEVAFNGASAYKQLFPRDIGINFEFNLMIELDTP